ncbi:cytochrome b, partial [Escherichia coli]|uniref:cytochrome b n=1 Tax=Escherichia coli TaxID=562 RepID=UPI0024AEC350
DPLVILNFCFATEWSVLSGGWLILSFNPTKVRIIQQSPFVTPNSEIKALIKNIHETWANIGYFLIAAHAGAALFHHYIQKDNTLLRMMPRRK